MNSYLDSERVSRGVIEKDWIADGGRYYSRLLPSRFLGDYGGGDAVVVFVQMRDGLVGDVEAVKRADVDTRLNSIPVTVSGSGMQTVTVYIDDKELKSTNHDFGS